VSGVLVSAAGVLLLARAFSLDHAQFVTLLPKSITSAFGMIIAEEYGGYPAITAAVIILSGIAGAILAGPIFRLFRIRSAVAQGIALGTAAHAIGTARALEMGPAEGAMASLSIAVCGLITVLAMPLLIMAG
jgi:putative effector of murein hydrolase